MVRFACWLHHRAYPRGRGGNIKEQFRYPKEAGLSPRTRGKLVQPHTQQVGVGPIPADAGETVGDGTLVVGIRAYPRGRGGNTGKDAREDAQAGLSPRTRGKLYHRIDHAHRLGPIPADAGETRNSRALWRSFGAYPRGRGGNRRHRPAILDHQGLSPRTRGKLKTCRAGADQPGPIPADAGETFCEST